MAFLKLTKNIKNADKKAFQVLHFGRLLVKLDLAFQC